MLIEFSRRATWASTEICWLSCWLTVTTACVPTVHSRWPFVTVWYIWTHLCKSGLLCTCNAFIQVACIHGVGVGSNKQRQESAFLFSWALAAVLQDDVREYEAQLSIHKRASSNRFWQIKEHPSICCTFCRLSVCSLVASSLVGRGRLKLAVSFGKASKARRGNSFQQFFYEAESARESGDLARLAYSKLSSSFLTWKAFKRHLVTGFSIFRNCSGIYIRDSIRV